MLSNPIYDPFQILTKVYSDGAHVKQAIADTYIEELYKGRTVKIVYGVLENDLWLDYAIKFYAPKSPKLAVRILLKISLYMLLFMDKQKYMVTDCTVSLCKKLGKSGVSGFVNAFLRRFDRTAVDEALQKEKDSEATLVSYPAYAYKWLKKEYGSRAKAIASAASAGISVRFEDGKMPEKYAKKPCLETPFAGNYIFEHFVRDDGFDEGEYTFQSVGSIAICDVVQPCESLLDACAAPGGKSVLLSKKCGKVTSFELHPHRVALIESYQKRMGRENVTAIQKDSSVYDEAYEEAFDGVLCDVPCSGFGTISENPDIKLFRKEQDFASLRKAQLGILEACCRYVKKGGTLYYSTCSLFERENDAIVAEFLKNHGEYSLTEIDSKLSHDKKQYGLQFLPDTAYGAGFYVCAMKKNG